VINPFQDQPLGYTEPRYDEIDGLAWAWNGGGNDLESVVGSMSPTYDFSGWRNTRVAANDRLEWTPERLTPRVSSVDFTLEFVGRYDSNDPVIFVGVGNPTVPAANSSMSAGYNSGTLRYLNVDGFTAHDSTLTFPSGVWCHCIMARYGNRMYSWLRRYDTGAVSRNLNAAPPINVITLSGAPKIFAAKSANSSILSNSSIAKAAIYTRGMPEAEAEDLLRDPWQTFRAPRRRLYLVQGTGGAGNAPGATITATTSIVAGAATGAAAAAGVTSTAALSFIGGAATGAAQAAGVTLTSALSFIAGAATAGTQAPGATLTASVSLIAGAATGAAFASGAVVSAALSFLPGAASGGAVVPGNAPGATMQAALVFLPGFASGDGIVAPGTTLTLSTTLIAGTASVILDPMTGGKVTAGRKSVYGTRPTHTYPRRSKH